MIPLVFNGVFWIASALCYIKDTDKKQYRQVFPLVAVNTLVIAPIFFTLWEQYICSFDGPFTIVRAPLAYIASDILFWYAHRLFHTDFLRPLHSVHHQMVRPVGLSAFYFHPLDWIVGNLLPYSMAFSLAGNKLLVYFLIVLGVSNTVMGAHGPYGSQERAHKRHHLDTKVNFSGGFHGWDRVMGTAA